MEFGEKSSKKSLPPLKPLEPCSTSKLEITKDQFDAIVQTRLSSNSRYASLMNFQVDAEKRFARSVGEASAVLSRLEDLQQKRDERNRIFLAIKDNSATREERQIYDKSKNLEKDLEALYKKEQQLSSDAEKNYEKVDKAKAALKEHDLAVFHSHVFEVQFVSIKRINYVIIIARWKVLQVGRRNRNVGPARTRGSSCRRSRMGWLLSARCETV